MIPTTRERRTTPCRRQPFHPTDRGADAHFECPSGTSTRGAFLNGIEIGGLGGRSVEKRTVVIRLKLPADYQIPAHHHSNTENVTVISGSLHAGMGDKLDKQTSKGFDPGGFVSMPANMNHFAWAASPTIIEIAAEGPFDIIYVDPANDPTKQ